MADRTFLERVFSTRRAHLVVAVVIATAVALAGIARLSFSDDYREIFRSETPEFALLEEIATQFRADEQRVLLLVEAPALFDAGTVAVLEYVEEQAAALVGVDQVESPLSVSGLPALMAATSEPSRRAEIAAAIRLHPMLGGQLVADDLGAVLVIVQLDADLRTLSQIDPVLSRIEEVARVAVRGSEVRITVSGLPAVRTEVVRSVQRDQFVFTGVGLTLGGLVAFVAFRHPLPAMIVGSGPVVGMIWTMGALGWLGQPIDVLNNVVPVLVLVIGMTDSVHVVRAFLARRAAGRPAFEASLDAVRRVGAACALTSLTTIVGFSSLAVTDVAIVRNFGLTSALGLALSFLAVMTVVPLITSSAVGGRIPVRRQVGESRWFPDWILAKHRAVAGTGLVVLAVLATSFWRLAPDYRYREYLPTDSAVLQGLEGIETHFGGVFPVLVVVDWDEGADESDVLAALDESAELVSALPSSSASFSVLNPIRSVLAGGRNAIFTQEALTLVPGEVRADLYRADLRRALVNVRVEGRGAARLSPVFSELQERLSAVASRYDGIQLRVSGLLFVSTRSSLRMLDTLTAGLMLAGPLVFALICWGLRSWRLGILSMAPNLLPLAVIATYLVLADRPLQFTTVILMTVCLAIAVDDTIHMLMDFRRRRASGMAAPEGMAETVTAIGPSLITTTALLVAGFGAVGLSQAPMMSLFGWLGCVAFLAALAADLILLPALVVAFVPSTPSGHKTHSSPGAGSDSDHAWT